MLDAATAARCGYTLIQLLTAKWRIKQGEWVMSTRAIFDNRQVNLGQFTIFSSIFDNRQVNLGQFTIFFFNLWQLAGQSLAIREKDLKISIHCERLTRRLSKIARFSSSCLWLVLLVYFLSQLSERSGLNPWSSLWFFFVNFILLNRSN